VNSSLVACALLGLFGLSACGSDSSGGGNSTAGTAGGGGTSGSGGSTGGAGGSSGGAGGTSGAGGTAATGGGAGAGGATGVWRPFSDASPWNTKIASDAKLDPDSQKMIDDLSVSSQWNFLGINIKGYSIPVYWADDSTPKELVTATYGGEGFPGQNGQNGQAMVPIPSDAAPDPESDHHMLIVHENKAISWDFWNAVDQGNTWSCGLCTTSDLLGTGVRPIQQGNPTWYTSAGSRACGFPLIAGLIRVEEMEAGKIEHALILAYPHIRAGYYTPPASTSQAKVGSDAIKTRGIPCGGRVQLDPTLDLDTLGLSASGKIVARALQEYGAYVGDYSGAINFYADGSPAAQAKWDAGLLDTYEIQKQVPLSKLRVIELGTLYDGGNGG